MSSIASFVEENKPENSCCRELDDILLLSIVEDKIDATASFIQNLKQQVIDNEIDVGFQSLFILFHHSKHWDHTGASKIILVVNNKTHQGYLKQCCFTHKENYLISDPFFSRCMESQSPEIVLLEIDRLASENPPSFEGIIKDIFEHIIWTGRPLSYYGCTFYLPLDLFKEAEFGLEEPEFVNNLKDELRVYYSPSKITEPDINDSFEQQDQFLKQAQESQSYLFFEPHLRQFLFDMGTQNKSIKPIEEYQYQIKDPLHLKVSMPRPRQYNHKNRYQVIRKALTEQIGAVDEKIYKIIQSHIKEDKAKISNDLELLKKIETENSAFIDNYYSLALYYRKFDRKNTIDQNKELRFQYDKYQSSLKTLIEQHSDYRKFDRKNTIDQNKELRFQYDKYQSSLKTLIEQHSDFKALTCSQLRQYQPVTNDLLTKIALLFNSIVTIFEKHQQMLTSLLDRFEQLKEMKGSDNKQIIAAVKDYFEICDVESGLNLTLPISNLKLYKYFNHMLVLAVEVEHQQIFDHWWKDLLDQDVRCYERVATYQLEHFLSYTKLARILYPTFISQQKEDKIANIKLYSKGVLIAEDKPKMFNVGAPHLPSTVKAQMSAVMVKLLNNFFNDKFHNSFDTRLDQISDDRMFVSPRYIFPYFDLSKESHAVYRRTFSYALTVEDRTMRWGCFDHYCYQPEFIEQSIMKQSLYDRWFNLGTLHGFTDCSNILMAAGSFSEVQLAQLVIPKIYDRMLLSALFYQRSLAHYNRCLNDATKVLTKQPLQKRTQNNSFSKLRQYFLEFTNNYWFEELTSQTQGKEIFKLQVKMLNIKLHYQQVKDEMQRADEFIRNKRSDEMVFWGVVFALTSVVLSYLSYVK